MKQNLYICGHEKENYDVNYQGIENTCDSCATGSSVNIQGNSRGHSTRRKGKSETSSPAPMKTPPKPEAKEKKKCCDVCWDSKYALRGKNKEKFGCGLSCECHREASNTPKPEASWEQKIAEHFRWMFKFGLQDGIFKEEHRVSVDNVCQNVINDVRFLLADKDFPMGASVWLAHGKRYGYLAYFLDERVKEAYDDGRISAENQMCIHHDAIEREAYEKGKESGYELRDKERTNEMPKIIESERQQAITDFVARAKEGIGLMEIDTKYADHIRDGYYRAIEEVLTLLENLVDNKNNA